MADTEATNTCCCNCSSIKILNADGDVRPWLEVERELIVAALMLYRGNISEAAFHLGLGRSTLYRKMHEFGIEIERVSTPHFVKKTILA